MPASDSSKPDKVLKSECKSTIYSSGSICLLQHPTSYHNLRHFENEKNRQKSKFHNSKAD